MLEHLPEQKILTHFIITEPLIYNFQGTKQKVNLFLGFQVKLNTTNEMLAILAIYKLFKPVPNPSIICKYIPMLNLVHPSPKFAIYVLLKNCTFYLPLEWQPLIEKTNWTTVAFMREESCWLNQKNETVSCLVMSEEWWYLLFIILKQICNKNNS